MRIRASRGARAESGQAAVETALTLPLTLFMLLGVLQLSMMLQARIMAQYAAYQAVRAGSLNKGDCRKMEQAALVSLLPTITRVRNPNELAQAFHKRCNPCDATNAGGRVRIRYDRREDLNTHLGATNSSEDNGAGYNQPIVEIYRERPTDNDLAAADTTNHPGEDTDFDEPRSEGNTVRLEIRMLYWYRLKIPFVDWVMSRMYLAYFGLQDFQKRQNPLMPTETASWTRDSGQIDRIDTETWPGGPPGPRMRTWSNNHHYLFPIKVSAAMRMMTPLNRKYFTGPGCPL